MTRTSQTQAHGRTQGRPHTQRALKVTAICPAYTLRAPALHLCSNDMYWLKVEYYVGEDF